MPRSILGILNARSTRGKYESVKVWDTEGDAGVRGFVVRVPSGIINTPIFQAAMALIQALPGVDIVEPDHWVTPSTLAGRSISLAANDRAPPGLLRIKVR